MLEVGKRYTSPKTGTWVEIAERSGDVMKFERSFAPGDRVAIEPGTVHRDPWNPGSGELHARGTFDPDNDFIEAYAAAYAHQLAKGEEGRLNDQDEMPLLQILVVARATDGRSYGASPPVAIQKAALPVAAAIGRMRGFKASYD